MMARWRADVEGVAAVEFAILTPVFLLMLMGMLAYGIYFGAAHSVQQIAADAARTSIAGLNAGERNSLVKAFIDNNARDYVFIDGRKVSYWIGDKPSDASQYMVTVRYDASDLPIWNLGIPLPSPGKVIGFTSVIRKGGI
ncbi:MAG: pilus assembly protein [Devosia nanyangense]|jgi:Flp pilus assembly protein TadG|uniref:TadE/TadG family type IV pilus assembly protein n=1 Tax=Paradevosia shaoguanensis TaxID=1335043 RepID=UPI00050278D4|nr:TadE/TadG family type IV pilus assembly protein [Paradevosia shaoguanensis]KFL24877.1 hypothetical protein JP74_22585 [Devosia sp. 17-2-E-8]MBI4046883.1 pilus assembly protein [Devosia nanyangense]QMV03856.1 pilus assembly protein [Devosia sp. D6-9]